MGSLVRRRNQPKVGKQFITKNEATLSVVYGHYYFTFFTFFFVHKKKILDKRKFWTSDFGWSVFDVLNIICSFLGNVCLYICLQNFVDIVAHESCAEIKETLCPDAL